MNSWVVVVSNVGFLVKFTGPVPSHMEPKSPTQSMEGLGVLGWCRDGAYDSNSRVYGSSSNCCRLHNDAPAAV